ncbi:MAG: TlpA family protein disulfide reductase [Gammaproteobacteria bacterium]
MTAVRTHRPLLKFGRACGLIALLWVACPAWAAPSLAPDWTLTRSDGQPLHFQEDARGNYAVLFFWTTWCPHCARALPYLEALRQEFAPRGVRFYALDIWEDGDAVAYFHAHGYHLPLFLAADLVAEEYGIEGTPGTVVVDPEGQLVDLALDGLPPARMAEKLRAHLAQHVPPTTVETSFPPPPGGTH